MKAQKIDILTLKMFALVMISFLLKNITEKVGIFEKILLLANTSIIIILKMFFIIFFKF